MKKIRFGILGAGAVAYENTGLFNQNPKVQLVSVTSRTEEHAKKFAKKFEMASYYTDYKKMFENEELDAVVICTPNYLHAEMAIVAAKAGKHVFCEKPLTTNLEDANKIINAVNKANIIFMYAAHQRFWTAYQILKKIIDKEVLGKISFVRARFSHKGPYTSWKASSKERWFFDKIKAGGGVLLDLGIHHIDTLIWLFGDISIIGATMGTFCKEIAWEDVASLVFKFKSGIICELETSWCDLPSNIIEVHGFNGVISLQALNYKSEPKIEFFPKKLKRNELVHSLKADMFMENVKKKMTDHFIECILENKEPIATARDGKKALEIVISAYNLS